MLDFHDLTLADKAAFDRCRAKTVIHGSEGAFATFFIWNSYYNLRVAEQDGFFFFRFHVRGSEPAYYMPIGEGDMRGALCAVLEDAHARGVKAQFRFVTEETLPILETYLPGRFSYVENRDQHDYIYATEQMISLAGKKLHAKRNHLNYFIEHFPFEYREVDSDFVARECAPLALEWVAEKERNQNSFELPAMQCYFENYAALNQRGAVIEVNGRIVAMSFGEQLEKDMALIQIELALDEYRGSYQVINQQFCEHAWKDCLYVNREEDMGIDGIRHAKESYQPVRLVKKFTATEM